MDRRLVALLAAIPVVAAGALVLNTVTGSSVAAKTPAANFIQGTVTSGKAKAEGGVWVIAEAKLGTGYRKIVVTDAKGRFVLPELPKAGYRVWVRGYGLRTRRRSAPGPAPTLVPPREDRLPAAGGGDLPGQLLAVALQPAARHAPAAGRSSRRGPGRDGTDFKLGCMLCHQIGSKARARCPSRRGATTPAPRRPASMYGTSLGLGREALLDSLADWSARIRGGETPEAPPRPKGVERNMVITQWNWGDKFTYAHDEVATDRNNPAAQRQRPGLRRRPRQRLPAEDRPGQEHLDEDQDSDRRGVQHPVVRPDVRAPGQHRRAGAERLLHPRRPRPGWRQRLRRRVHRTPPTPTTR